MAEERAFYQAGKNIRAIIRLLRTCRTLYRVVLPILHQIVIYVSRPSRPPIITRNILNALSAFQSNPEAGAMVQTMILGQTTPYLYWGRDL